MEYVVKNPLGPAEHPNGEGVAVEFFELALDQFIQGLPYVIFLLSIYKSKFSLEILQSNDTTTVCAVHDDAHPLSANRLYPTS